MYKKRSQGFTVIELMVCVAVIGIISAIVFANGRGLDDTVALASAGQDVSLAIREAQLYGTSVRDAGSGTFTDSYGIVFDLTNSGATIVFADSNANKIYDGSASCSGECVDRQLLENNVKISKICAVNSVGTQVCGATWRSIDVLFTRPSLDAVITVVNTSGSIVAGPWQTANITLSSPLGSTKVVSVNTTGEMSVQ